MRDRSPTDLSAFAAEPVGLFRAANVLPGAGHMFTPLFRGDGGHGMLFRTFDGQLTLTLHQPNRREAERMKVFPIGTSWSKEEGGASNLMWESVIRESGKNLSWKAMMTKLRIGQSE